jgi:hypothetical protein
MQRPASCRWQKVVLGVGLYTQCGAVSTLDGSIKVPVHNTRRAAIDTGVVTWNVALKAGDESGFAPDAPLEEAGSNPRSPARETSQAHSPICRLFQP